jgi:hypothetical protein
MTTPQTKALGIIKMNILMNKDLIYRLQLAELRRAFGFQEWSEPRRATAFRLLAINGIGVQPALDEVRDDDWIELSIPKPVKEQITTKYNKYGGPSTIEIVVVASTLGPLSTAFCTELGKRFGGTVADWISRVRTRRRNDNAMVADMIVDDGETVTSLEITEALTDEAKLALLDLDISNKAIRGKNLRWDSQSKAWVPRGREPAPSQGGGASGPNGLP